MTTTPKKAPTASDALFLAASELHDKHAPGWAVQVLRDRAFAAERAEAEAAQEPGDSVEGLMRECVELAEGGDRIYVRYDDGTYAAWVGPGINYHTSEHEGPASALRALRDSLTPAAPDATWLDTATFEEMEACLPDDIEILSGIRSSVPGFWVRRTFEAQFSGVFAPTRTEAVRAYLQANPELWSNRK